MTSITRNHLQISILLVVTDCMFPSLSAEEVEGQKQEFILLCVQGYEELKLSDKLINESLEGFCFSDENMNLNVTNFSLLNINSRPPSWHTRNKIYRQDCRSNLGTSHTFSGSLLVELTFSWRDSRKKTTNNKKTSVIKK